MSYSIDKRRLLGAVIQAVKEEIESLKVAYKHARETSIVSPTRMQSRYDTMGVEAAWKADTLARSIKEKAQALEYLERVPLSSGPLRAAVGTVVAIGPDGGQVREFYFILPAGGGQRIHLADGTPEVVTITFQAPLAQNLVGRRVGDAIESKGGQGSEDIIHAVV